MRATIKFVNFPKNPTAKYGNVMLETGATVMIPVGKLDLYRRGMICEMNAQPETWGDRPMTVCKDDPVPVGQVPAPNYPQAIADYRPQEGQGALPGMTGQLGTVTQFPQQNPLIADYRPVRVNPEAKSIYVTGIVGRAMGSGKYTASEIEVLTAEAIRVYDKLLGPQQG